MGNEEERARSFTCLVPPTFFWGLSRRSGSGVALARPAARVVQLDAEVALQIEMDVQIRVDARRREQRLERRAEVLVVGHLPRGDRRRHVDEVVVGTDDGAELQLGGSFAALVRLARLPPRVQDVELVPRARDGRASSVVAAQRMRSTLRVCARHVAWTGACAHASAERVLVGTMGCHPAGRPP